MDNVTTWWQEAEVDLTALVEEVERLQKGAEHLRQYTWYAECRKAEARLAQYEKVVEASRIEGVIEWRCEQEESGSMEPDPYPPRDPCYTASWATRQHWCLSCRCRALQDRITALDSLDRQEEK